MMADLQTIAPLLQGHPLVCSNNSGCQSKLRVLRAASIPLPCVETFLHQLSSARTSHRCINDIGQALCAGQYHRLMDIAQINGFESLISNDVESSYEQCTDVAGGKSVLRQPNLEVQLLITRAELIIVSSRMRFRTFQSMLAVAVRGYTKGKV